MNILTDHHVERSPGLLDEAWIQPETLAVYAEKSGVSGSWIAKALAALPSALHRGHFILLTSGSTGQPKLVIGAKERSEKLARLLHQLQDAEIVKEAIVALPLTYCYAFVNQWLWARLFKRRLVL